MEEQDVKESPALQHALEKLGIKQKFNYADHAEIYNYAQVFKPSLNQA
jgi:ssDNA-specific exonuclease RecJ